MAPPLFLIPLGIFTLVSSSSLLDSLSRQYTQVVSGLLAFIFNTSRFLDGYSIFILLIIHNHQQWLSSLLSSASSSSMVSVTSSTPSSQTCSLLMQWPLSRPTQSHAALSSSLVPATPTQTALRDAAASIPAFALVPLSLSHAMVDADMGTLNPTTTLRRP